MAQEKLNQRRDWMRRMVSVVAKFGTGPLDNIDERHRFLVRHLDAYLTAAGVGMQVAVRNISGGGLCVVCDLPLATGDLCTVALADGNPAGRPYRAEVRWVKSTETDLFLVGLQILNALEA